MNNYSFNSTHSEQPITTGYVGAIAIVVLSLAIIFLKPGSSQLLGLSSQRNDLLLLMVILSFFSMLVAEYLGKQIYIANGWIKANKIKIKKTSFHLITSTLYRFTTLLIVFYLIFFIVNKHYYFSDDSFQITKHFFNTFLLVYLFLGIPYIFLTLKYRWSIKYDLNDYSLNLMLLFRGLIYLIYGTLFRKSYYLKRAKKNYF